MLRGPFFRGHSVFANVYDILTAFVPVCCIYVSYDCCICAGKVLYKWAFTFLCVQTITFELNDLKPTHMAR